MVLERYLNDREDGDEFPISKLSVEIDIEEGQDLLTRIQIQSIKIF